MEQWIIWEPIKGLSEKYYIDSVINSVGQGFIVLLSESEDRKRQVKIVFENSVDCYRSAEEGYRLKMMEEIGKVHGTKFYGYWTFFKVIHSTYISWLKEQSYGLIDESFTHFSLIGADLILDIVTTYEPKVELIEGD